MKKVYDVSILSQRIRILHGPQLRGMTPEEILNKLKKIGNRSF